MMTLGRYIKQCRAARGWKQKDLQQASGISQKYLSRIENDAADPGWGILQKIIAALDLDLRVLCRSRQQRDDDA